MQHKKEKSRVKKRIKRTNKENKIAAFFGKLPNIEDGLTFQKRVRSEWR
jgi:hypothetical protein